MSAPGRPKPAVSAPGEDAQLSEFLSEPVERASEPVERPSARVERRGEPLPWQRELDVAIADIDSRLSHPRRRATDMQPTLPQLGHSGITSETIDEIAWRVAELLRKHGDAGHYRGEAVAAAISQTVAASTAAPAASSPAERDRTSGGFAVSLRIRRPFFRWPFRRRKRPMITFSDYRVT